MTISLTHSKVSHVADTTDDTLIQPSDWNHEHVLTTSSGVLVGRSSAGTGAAEEITIGSNLTLAGGVLSATGGGGGGSGTVTSVSVASANGFSGSVTNPTTTPAISVGTSVTGLLKGNGTGVSAATAGTDYQAPIGTISGLAKGNGANALTSAVAGTDYVAPSVLGAANGVATLDSGGKLTAGQIPDISIVTYLGSVASQAAMLALTGQQGDWCTRSDLGTNWVITGSTPSSLASWTQLSYPTAPVTSVNGYTGAVTLSKGDVGLGNVDNTSDATKNAATATLTNIGNGSLTNSSITIGSTAVALGATLSTLIGIADSTTNGGHYSKGAFGGTYTDGIVLDYVTGTGRISVGTADGLSIYNGGVGGTALLNLDSSGNLGLGVTPNTWYLMKAIQVGVNGSYVAGDSTYNYTYLGANNYYNGSWYYKNSGYATRFAQGDGAYYWYTAPSGTAGSAISFTQAMTLNQYAELAVGGTGLVYATSGRGNISINGTSSALLGFKVNGANSGYFLHNGTNIDLMNGANGDLTFGTNAAEKMRLTSAGYLGIGTSSPSFPSGGGVAIYDNTAPRIKLTNSTTGDASTDGTHLLVNGSDFYIQQRESANVIIAIGGSDRATFDASGNLGLGVTPSGWSGFKALELNGGSIASSASTNITLLQNAYFNGSSWTYKASSAASRYDTNSGAHYWYTAPSGTAGNAISFTQAMTLNASGQLFVGATSFTSAQALSVAGSAIFTGGVDGQGAYIGREGSTGGAFYSALQGLVTIATPGTNPITFQTSSSERARIDSSGNFMVAKSAASDLTVGHCLYATGAYVTTMAASTNASATLNVYSTGASAYRFYVDMGGTVHATSTSITAISDISLKENIRPLETGLAEVMALKPRRFDWKNGDGSDVAGFIAQEVIDVLPDLVSDFKYNDDETKKAVKMGDMIPTMVRAIQELKAELDQLKATLH